MSFFSKARKLSPFLRWLLRIRFEGWENLPDTGPVILCSNHRSNLDPVLLSVVLRRDLFFMAKASLFKVPLLNILIRSLGAFPVERGVGDLRAVERAMEIVRSGEVLAMFPEGHRLREAGQPQRFRSGAALIAAHTGAPVVPAAILCEGRMRFFKKKYIRIGRPIQPSELGLTDTSRENLQKASGLIREAVCALMAQPAVR